MTRVGARTTEDGSAICNNRIHTIGTAGHSDKASDIEDFKYYPISGMKIDELNDSTKHSRLKELLLDIGFRLTTNMVLLWNVECVSEAQIEAGEHQKHPSFIGAEVESNGHLLRVITSGNTTRYGIYKNKKWNYRRNFETIRSMV